MEFLIILVPIIITGLTLGVLYYFRILEGTKVLPYYVMPTVFVAIVVAAMSCIMRNSNFQDTEYLSYYYTKIRHTDEWDEWIERTCTETVRVGEDSDGNPIYEEREYDCSYREYHPERWYKYDNRGNETYIGKEEYEELRALWNTPMRFIDMHRDFYTIDGDAQEYDWCGEWEHCKTYTTTHSYENRILGSQSAFRFREVTDEEAKELGLYKYPDTSQPPILGHKAAGRINQRFRYLNAYYGMTKQIHVFVLIYPHQKGASIVEEQRAYWQGGNKNEFVVCLGIDPSWKIHWASCFSWQDDITFDAKCKQWLLGQKKMNLDALALWIEGHLGLWKRKPFADFSYIQSYLSEDQISTILWTAVILSIVLVIGVTILVTYEN